MRPSGKGRNGTLSMTDSPSTGQYFVGRVYQDSVTVTSALCSSSKMTKFHKVSKKDKAIGKPQPGYVALAVRKIDSTCSKRSEEDDTHETRRDTSAPGDQHFPGSLPERCCLCSITWREALTCVRKGTRTRQLGLGKMSRQVMLQWLFASAQENRRQVIWQTPF